MATKRGNTKGEERFVDVARTPRLSDLGGTFVSDDSVGDDSRGSASRPRKLVLTDELLPELRSMPGFALTVGGDPDNVEPWERDPFRGFSDVGEYAGVAGALTPEGRCDPANMAAVKQYDGCARAVRARNVGQRVVIRRRPAAEATA